MNRIVPDDYASQQGKRIVAMSDLPIRIIVLFTALVQIIVPFFVSPFQQGNNPVRAELPSQIEPAGYAFSIWGLIDVFALGYGVWQLTPDGRADPVTARIAPYAIILYVGCALWLAAAQYGPLWATMPILIGMAACASIALVLSTNMAGASTWRYWAVIVPFGLYAGWTVCAMFVNVAEVAPQFGFNRFGLSVVAYAMLSLAAAPMLAAVIIFLTRGELAFAMTVLWALAAIIVAGRERGADGAFIAASGIGFATIVLVTLAVRFLPAYR
jgi:hypothetical protein